MKMGEVAIGGTFHIALTEYLKVSETRIVSPRVEIFRTVDPMQEVIMISSCLNCDKYKECINIPEGYNPRNHFCSDFKYNQEVKSKIDPKGYFSNVKQDGE